MKKIIQILCIVCVSVLGSCDWSNEVNDFENSSTVIDDQLYGHTDGYDYSIKNAVVEGDLLKVEIATGGCSSAAISGRLIDSGIVAESSPVQRYARIQLTNKEPDCFMYIVKTFAFDLKPLRVKDEKNVIIHLQKWNNALVYKY